MRLRTAFGPWTTALFTTLGLSPLAACGGTTIEGNPPGSSGGEQSFGGSGGGNVIAGGAQNSPGGFQNRGDGGGKSIRGCQNPKPQLDTYGKPTGFTESTPNVTLLAHGVLGDEARSEIRRRVLAEIVLPCARVLASTNDPRTAAPSVAVAA